MAQADTQQIGPWAVGERLGGGGNADVYEASDGSTFVALKVLKTRRAESEQYERFRREIALLRQHGHDPGVLPILADSLPEKPSRENPAWIAMPIATPIRLALQDAPLDTTVSAIAEIAETLSRLAADGIAHRDLKPANLYQHAERWVVGDFGLVHLPDAPEGLTSNRLGPFGFMPDEMFDSASTADPLEVDVYQLAKCLLVLAAGTNVPPQGHVAARTSGALSRYVTAARVEDLDDIIDRSTRRDPTRRPTMLEFAADLRVWLAYRPPAGEPDLDAVLARFRETHQDSLEGQSLRDAWRSRFEDITRDAEESIVPWVEALLQRAGIPSQARSFHELHEWVERTRFVGRQPELVAEQVWITGEFGRPEWPTKVAVGIGFDLDIVGEFWCEAYVAWGDLESLGSPVLEVEERVAPIESIAARAAVDELFVDVREACARMMNALAEPE